MKAINEYLRRKTALSRMFVVSLVLCILFIGPDIVKAQYDPFTNITDDGIPNYDPAIDGNYIVYHDRRNGGGDDIFLYNIETKEEIDITSDPGYSSVFPDISGNLVVWQDNRNGNWDIYAYNISKPDRGAYPLINFPDDQISPAIHGNILVWADHRGNDFSANIYMYNLETHELAQITDDSEYQQTDPDVYGHYIVYENVPSGGDIYLYNIFTKEKTLLTEGPGDQRHPSIYGNRVVWQDNRDGNWNIYMHVIGFMPGTPFEYMEWKIKAENDNSNKTNPVIWSDYIVYQDDRNGPSDLYMYCFTSTLSGNEVPLVVEEKAQKNPTVSGNRVVWQDERDWEVNTPYTSDIWLWERPPGADLGVTVNDHPDPVIVGNELEYKIYIKNFGIEDATNVVLTDILSDNVTFLRATSNNGGSFTRKDNTITYPIGDLPRGETDTVKIVIRPFVTGEIGNNASVTATETDPVPDNNSSFEPTDVEWGYKSYLGTGKDPVIAVDASGRTHICYLSGENDLLYTTNNKTGEWSLDTLAASEQVSSYAIATDTNDHVHIAYAIGDWDAKKLMYINDTAGTWSSPEIMDDEAGQGLSINIKIDRDNYYHISYMISPFSGPLVYFSNKTPLGMLWNCNNSAALDVDTAGYAYISYYENGIMFRTNSPDGAWKGGEIADNNWNGGQMESLVTDIAVDRNGDPHISYAGAQGTSGNEDIRYAFKLGGVWQDIFIDDGGFEGSASAIAMDVNNKPHIIYYHSPSDEIRYATNVSGSWIKHIFATNVEGDPYSTGSDIATDASGYIHMVYVKGDNVFYISDRQPPEPAPEPAIYVRPRNVNFYARVIENPTAPEKVTIKNYGDMLLSIDDISIIWRDSIHFTITNNTCSSLEPLDTCSVDIVFNPLEAGDIRAQLMIISNDPDDPKEFVKLKGKGLESHMFDYGETDFGDVELGDSVVHDYVIKNLGNDFLAIYSVDIEDGDAEDFYYTGLPATPFTISENDSVVLNLIFKPSSLGFKTSILKIFTNNYNPERTLTGTGIKLAYTISGSIVTPDGIPVNEGWVLIHMWDNPEHTAWYTKNYHLEGANEFLFQDISEGEVTLYVYPDTTKYPGYLRTYLGNTAVFDEAEFFHLNHDTTGLKITLVQAPPSPNGNSKVSGVFVEEEGNRSDRTLTYGTYNESGTPINEASVFLYGQNGRIIDLDTTTFAGEFVFENIPAGHYRFVADYVGFYMDESNDSLVIDQENQKFRITAIAHNNLINVEVENVTSICSLNENSGVYVYPNPVKDNIFVKFGDALDNEAVVWLLRIDGTVVREINLSAHLKNTLLRIPVSGLHKGIYILNIKGEGINYNAKIIKR